MCILVFEGLFYSLRSQCVLLKWCIKTKSRKYLPQIFVCGPVCLKTSRVVHLVSYFLEYFIANTFIEVYFKFLQHNATGFKVIIFGYATRACVVSPAGTVGDLDSSAQIVGGFDILLGQLGVIFFC